MIHSRFKRLLKKKFWKFNSKIDSKFEFACIQFNEIFIQLEPQGIAHPQLIWRKVPFELGRSFELEFKDRTEFQESGCHKLVIWDDSGVFQNALAMQNHLICKTRFQSWTRIWSTLFWSKIVLEYNHLKCVHSLASELVQLDYTLAYLLIYFDAGSCIMANQLNLFYEFNVHSIYPAALLSIISCKLCAVLKVTSETILQI